MKVLMAISQFHPMIGGAERQAQLLSEKLLRKGIDVKVVTGWWKIGTSRKEIINGIQLFRNFSLWGMFGIRGLRPLAALTYMVTLGIYLLYHKEEYDIIHVHQALHPAFVSVFMGKNLRKPVVVKTASSGKTSDIKNLKQIPLGSFQLRYLLKHMECLVTVSKVGGREFKETGFPGSQIIHIPNGVLLPQNQKVNYGQVKRVVTVARLSHEKGIDILLKAWANIAIRGKELRLTIIGYGPLEVELKRLSKSLGVSESIEFAGMRQKVNEYLQDADLFVLPSRAEGMSNALLEAMSYGLPCVATNVGGNGELLGLEDQNISTGEFSVGRNGLLVNSEDIDGLSKAILYLIQDHHLRREMGQRSRLFVQENHSIDVIADKYIDLYQKLLEKRSKYVWHLWSN